MDPLTIAAGEAAAGKVGETLVDVAKDAMNTEFVKTLLGKFSLALGEGFQRYLRNAQASYNEVRTLATEPDLRTMLGENGIYVQVCVGLTQGRTESEIPASNADALLKYGNRILIEGSGGMGKSMLMKYLFLHTIRNNAYMKKPYIPVFLELRRVSEQKPGQISIPELVYACMRNYDVELPHKYFPESLRMGKYLFLLDGFDEVKDSLSSEVAEKLNDFSTQYPQNAFIVTSRPANDYENAPFRNFVKMRSMPLNKEQAVELAQRISKTWTWQGDREKADDFCKQLEATLYEKHKTFAENPLLLSMMFLTFMRNSSIPDHEAEFYRESYDALYSKHDTHDKGSFQREFKCGDKLSKEDFTKLFARLCFQSYLDETYGFSEEAILNYLWESIAYLKLAVNAEDYLDDLRKIVCMIVREGDIYQFAHRSFQDYFAAVYTAGLGDADQKRVLDTIIGQNNSNIMNLKVQYCRLLFQLEGERFMVNALEERLRKLRATLEIKCYGHTLDESRHYGRTLDFLPSDFWFQRYCSEENKREISLFLLKYIFGALTFREGWRLINFNVELLYIYVLKGLFPRTLSVGPFHTSLMRPLEDMGRITWDCIDNSECLTVLERQQFYDYLIGKLDIPEFYRNMERWLNELDKNREKAKRDDFYRNL